jgi:hypothetical protein
MQWAKQAPVSADQSETGGAKQDDPWVLNSLSYGSFSAVRAVVILSPPYGCMAG